MCGWQGRGTGSPLRRSPLKANRSVLRAALTGALLLNLAPGQTPSGPVAVTLDQAFLAASKALGNDLSTPKPEYGFQGLKPGDRWCVCAARWLQVEKAGAACAL